MGPSSLGPIALRHASVQLFSESPCLLPYIDNSDTPTMLQPIVKCCRHSGSTPRRCSTQRHSYGWTIYCDPNIDRCATIRAGISSVGTRTPFATGWKQKNPLHAEEKDVGSETCPHPTITPDCTAAHSGGGHFLTRLIVARRPAWDNQGTEQVSFRAPSSLYTIIASLLRRPLLRGAGSGVAPQLG